MSFSLRCHTLDSQLNFDEKEERLQGTSHPAQSSQLLGLSSVSKLATFFQFLREASEEAIASDNVIAFIDILNLVFLMTNTLLMNVRLSKSNS